jgi:hypothetical protein
MARTSKAAHEAVAPDRKVVHIVTRVQAVFGVLDEDGNVLSKTPINVEVERLDEATFQELLQALREARAQLAAPELRLP